MTNIDDIITKHMWPDIGGQGSITQKDASKWIVNVFFELHWKQLLGTGILRALTSTLAIAPTLLLKAFLEFGLVSV